MRSASLLAPIKKTRVATAGLLQGALSVATEIHSWHSGMSSKYFLLGR